MLVVATAVELLPQAATTPTSAPRARMEDCIFGFGWVVWNVSGGVGIKGIRWWIRRRRNVGADLRTKLTTV